MITKVLLDLDGVIADFISGVCGFYDVPYDAVQAEIIKRGSADCVKVAGDLCSRAVHEFWQGIDREFWLKLNKLPEADAIIDAAIAKVGAENVGILTSPGFGPENVIGKLAWIDRYYPSFAERTIITRAKYLCAGPNTVLVDDWERMVDSFRQAGGSAILVPRFWNIENHLRHRTLEVVQQRLILI